MKSKRQSARFLFPLHAAVPRRNYLAHAMIQSSRGKALTAPGV